MTLCACPVLWGFLLTIKAETKRGPQTYFTEVLEWRSFLVPAIFSLSAVSMLLETEPHHIVQAHLELTMQSKLASKLQASCLSRLSSRITGLTTIPNLNLCCHFSICYEHIQFLPLNLLGKNHGEKTAQHLCSSAHMMSTKLMKAKQVLKHSSEHYTWLYFSNRSGKHWHHLQKCTLKNVFSVIFPAWKNKLCFSKV